jgi:hypothetical protein
MKFFRLDLLTLLISLFILNSCKNQDTIGLPANAGGQISGSLTDTSTVFTNTVVDTTVATESLTKVPFGYFNDPALGSSESDLINDLNLPGATAYTLPAGTVVIDSVILMLKYTGSFYGDSVASKYTANVYQLNERVYPGQVYYDNKQWNYNSGTVLGTKSFYMRPHTKLKVTTIVKGGRDTLLKISPQIRIPINPSFINQNLFHASAAQLNSNLIFKNNVKGLFVKIDKNQLTGPGGICMLQPADSLAVYIHTLDGSVIDTSVVYLNITQHASQISHTYSQKVLDALNHTKPSDTVIYLQGLASLRAKISFPYIKNLFNSVGGINNVVINRAELVLTAGPGTDIPSYLVPQPKLAVYKYDIAHQLTYIEDASPASPTYLGVGAFGGYYNSPTRNYHFLLTTYIQNLVRGNTIDYGTYIAPVDTTNITRVDIAATPQTAGRTIAVGNNKSSPYRIKLNVVYIKLNKQ